jgi:single stranded DNA-binding protein
MMVANFSIAVDRRKTERDPDPEPLWIKCAVWGKRAQTIVDYFKKGSQIIVTGEIDMESYTTSTTGQEVFKLALKVQDFDFCGPKPDDRAPAGSAAAPARAAAPAPSWNAGPLSDEEVPF